MQESTTSRPESTRLDWLDALRGWAVLGVVIVHSGEAAHSSGYVGKIASSGQYGVQLFFLVSALTISLTYESHIRQFGRSVRSQFAWLIKRFFRIAPLYYFAAIFYPIEQYAIHVASHHRYGSTVAIPAILANLLFLHTWIPSANNCVVPGGWSIGVEMFFYTLVPFVWMIVPVRRRVVFLGLSAVAFLAVTTLVSKLSTGSFYVVNNSYLYFWFPAQAPVIILGLIFYFLHGPKLYAPRTYGAAAISLGGFLLCLPVALYFGTADEAAPILAPTILAFAFILLILGMHGWVKGVIVNRYAILLGKISFSVYIFHFVVLDFIRAIFQIAHFDRFGPLTLLPVLATVLVLTSIIALVSKRVVEDPSIAYGHNLSRSVALRHLE